MTPASDILYMRELRTYKEGKEVSNEGITLRKDGRRKSRTNKGIRLCRSYSITRMNHHTNKTAQVDPKRYNCAFLSSLHL